MLDDDGFVLWESHAIMQYLADRTPGQTRVPRGDIRARADVNRWLFWSAHHFTPAVSVLGWENMVKRMVGAGDPDPAAVKRGEGLVTDCAAILDAHLAGKRGCWATAHPRRLRARVAAHGDRSGEAARDGLRERDGVVREGRGAASLEEDGALIVGRDSPGSREPAPRCESHPCPRREADSNAYFGSAVSNRGKVRK